jgi:hypothetical protein
VLLTDNSRHSLDSTTVRGHVSAAGVKGGRANKLLAVRGAGSPVKFIVSVMPEASPLVFHLTPGEAADSSQRDN